MKFSKLATLVLATTIATSAHAIDSLKIMIPANPGGGWDQTGRSFGQAAQAAGLIKSAQYDNKGGAGGTIGLSQFVNSSKGDPSALLVSGLVMVGAIELQKSPVNLSMVTPIARLTSEANAIVVPAGSKLKTLRDLLDQFKAQPTSVSWAGGSAGGVDHIMVGLIAKEIGVNPASINYVPFKGGGEALQAIIGGHVTAGVSGYGEFAEQIKSGKLRALAVSGASRISGVDVPTLREQSVDVEVGNWRGVFAAPGIKPEQRQALIKLVSDTTASAAWKEVLHRMDWSGVLLTGDEFKTFLEAEKKRVAGVLRDIGLAK